VSRWLLLLGLCAAPVVASARAPDADDAGALAFADVLARMKRVSAGITEYTVRFYKREWVDGETMPAEVADIAFRRPFDVRMTWVEGHPGRVLLYRGKDWNDGRFVIDPGPMLPVISLHPESRMANSGSRHNLYDLPITEVVAKFVRDAEKVSAHPTWQPDVVDEGSSTVKGEPTRCFLSKLPKDQDATFYATQVRACVSPVTGLPNSFKAWDLIDGQLILVEEYEYIGFDLAPGLTDADFDREALGL